MPHLFSEKIKATHPPTEPILTLELSPPKGVDTDRLLARASALKGLVDAINVPDCQRALLRQSSLAAAVLIEQKVGIETIWQLTCRDRNLIALQADLLGGYALGLKNVLALTGDPVQIGDQKTVAQQVFHLDAVRLLTLLNKLNAGIDATETPFKDGGTAFVTGSALNPLRLHNQAQKKRLCLKLEAGVGFFQTQPLYHREPLEAGLEALAGCVALVGCESPKVLLGMVPPKSGDSARFLNKTVPGIAIPQGLIDRLDRAIDPADESLHYCAELLGGMAGLVDGVHLMPVVLEKRCVVFVQRVRAALGLPTLERPTVADAFSG
jgi:methylenetetrahydrofolate reductase (NADPH)